MTCLLLTLCILVFQVDSADNQPWARQARITALVRTKNFEQALELTSKSNKELFFERAYILHRLGKNKEALEAIRSSGELDSEKVKHLLSQVVS